jgi:hypothetical protein
MKKKLYVGNLSFETTESDLKELFGQAGTVETVRIITDRDTGRSRRPQGWQYLTALGESIDEPKSPRVRSHDQLWLSYRSRGIERLK